MCRSGTNAGSERTPSGLSYQKEVSEELINNEIQLYFSVSASLAFKKLSVIPKFKKPDDSRRIINYCIKSNEFNSG